MYTIERLFWHLKNEKNLLRWLVSRFLFYTGIGKFFIVNCGTYKIRFFSSGLSLTKYVDPSYGYDDESLLRKILRPKDIVVDVGANIGIVSLAAASLVGESGRVIAFEPNPHVFKYLTKNIQLNRFNNVTSLNFALGDKLGNVYFSDQRCDDQNKVLPQGGLEVPMRTLDEQLSHFPGRIRLLKVDVEGYEKFVFLGGTNTLARTDYIYFEVYDPHFITFGYTTSELLQMLKCYKFGFYQIDERGQEIPVDTDFIPERCMNLLGKRYIS